jgi:glucosamine-phosphate N-acetyltransferase
MNLIYRNIECNDYYKGYIKLIKKLSNFNNDILYEQFNNYINNLNNNYKIIVILLNDIIIGSGTIFIENKIIHNFGNVAHIEDIIIDNNYRNLKLGKKLIDKLIFIAKENNCYKIILNCNDDNILFYEKCGFIKKENQMALYF